ncbi:MAG: HAMP domain-containing histidine kinase [Clostridia bacterium]|nr:HAMP domain-containing histidine kinase [Clostridia bacterium]
MKNSKSRVRQGIQAKLILYLLAFVCFIIVLLWVFQILLLDDFYRGFKARQITQTAEAIVQNLDLDTDSLESLASQLAEQNDVCILLLDGNQAELVSAEGTRNCLIHRVSSRSLSFWCDKAPEDGTPITEMFRMQATALIGNGSFLETSDLPSEYPFESTFTPSPDSGDERGLPAGRRDARKVHLKEPFYASFVDQESTTMSMLYARRVLLTDGSTGTLLLNSQISPVYSTVAALRSQLLVITVIVSLAALLISYLMARRLSRPIIETNEAAKALSRAQYTRPQHARGYREIAELNDTLLKAADDLSQVENLQHELIANISHDLRTPLTMIGGYAEMMRDLPSETTPENMQIIIDETARLTTLVNELLDFSRMQAGATEMQPATFCLTDSVEQMVLRVGKLTAKDGYCIDFSPSEHIQTHADETRIGQVVYNLLGNALTYTGDDKTVTVLQERRGDVVRISVRDSGKGIAKDELDLIWNRYYRTRETHRRAVIGSGLGLNIVRTILEKHEAAFGVDSEEGKGTTFWFELPIVKED